MARLAHIGLGSNLGDRKAILDGVVAQLRQTPELLVRSVSTYHETKPVGGPAGQGPFLNAAAALETTLDPIALLHRLQEIEADAGRVRTVRWGERTLDLDVLLFGDEIIDRPDLSVPHPRMGVRRFVLVPLEEIASAARDPLTGRSISELRANLDRRPSYLALEGWWSAPEKRAALERLVVELNTGCWSQRDLEELAPQIRSLSESSRKPFGLLEVTLGFLEARKLSSLGDQWIVTDFTVADLVWAAKARWGPTSRAGPGSLVSRLVTQEVELIEPTFIVDGKRPAGDRPEVGALLRSTPRLRLESGGLDQQVSEILTACAATRT
ncbi:MAG: 2-amino-4-hydroxy-6-hydroxymethyldihydropteridine diphosphokinase [Isosphaeraceae bacterium]|jgi:2-amino-4-hydroxy-6-hydroxymethyldihydropteridine diphosphokinase